MKLIPSALPIVISSFIFSGFANDTIFDEKFTIDNFKLGGADYIITGGKAIFSGNVGVIDGVQALFNQERGDMRLFTPRCTLNQIDNECHSDRRVHLRSKNFMIDGVGFDLVLAKHRLFIRNDVRVRIFGNQINLLGE